MKILAKFIINTGVWIDVTIPAEYEKINYFYKPTSQLHQFDEATAILYIDKKEILLYRNTVDEVFFRLRYFLNKVIKRNSLLIKILLGRWIFIIIMINTDNGKMMRGGARFHQMF